MRLECGDVVVYPHHGAVTVRGIRERDIGGVSRAYVQLDSRSEELTIEVPVDSAEDVGIRPVMGARERSAIFDVLRGEASDEPENWSRRFKMIEQKMSTSDPALLADVVRNLYQRNVTSRLSPGEKRMYHRARAALITEIALSIGDGDGVAEVAIDECLEKSLR